MNLGGTGLTFLALALVFAAGCSAVEDQVVHHLETTITRKLEREEQPTYSTFGETSLQLVCQRTSGSTMDCYTVPIRGVAQSCMKYHVRRKDKPDFQQLMLGEINRVQVVGLVPGAQCPRA